MAAAKTEVDLISLSSLFLWPSTFHTEDSLGGGDNEPNGIDIHDLFPLHFVFIQYFDKCLEDKQTQPWLQRND